MSKKETAKVYCADHRVDWIGDPDGTGCCVLYHLVGSKYESYDAYKEYADLQPK